MEEYYIKTLPAENFITRVYMWMTAALGITATAAYFVSSSPAVYNAIIGQPIAYFGLIIAELILVIVLSSMIERLNYSTALIIFLTYSAISGITLAPIIKFYTGSSVAIAFLTSGLMFGSMALYGYYTRRDLSKFGSILMMALLGLIISMVVNMFFKSTAMDFLISGIGVIIFCGLTAWDMQKIKNLASSAFEDIDTFNKLALLGALALYLDLINLFLFILRFVGKRRND